MASSTLLARAAKEIQSKNKTIAKFREDHKESVSQTMHYGAVLAGNGGAAFIDSKYGDGESVPETMGLPRNAVIGLAGVAYGLAAPKNAPLKSTIGFAGVGFLGAALYRYSFDKLEEREAKKAAEEAARAG